MLLRNNAVPVPFVGVAIHALVVVIRPATVGQDA